MSELPRNDQHVRAEQSAASTSRISQACSDASYLKIMVGILIPFGVMTFFPFLGIARIVGFVFIKYAVPVMTIRWWIKYAASKQPTPTSTALAARSSW